MIKTKWFEESPGVVSSKRLLGGLAFAFGIAGKLVLYIAAIFWGVADAATASAQSDAALIAGASLLGLTAVDNFKVGG